MVLRYGFNDANVAVESFWLNNLGIIFIKDIEKTYTRRRLIWRE